MACAQNKFVQLFILALVFALRTFEIRLKHFTVKLWLAAMDSVKSLIGWP